MELVNDARLMDLGREPAKELLPSARCAAVAQPLVILLAFLPGLLGFGNRSLDEATCRQGLLALDVAAAERPIEWFLTASTPSAANSAAPAPLATLLTAVGLQVELLSPESRLRLVSYLSSAWLLLCLGGLAKTIGGARLALLVVGLACGHREFLSLSDSLPPTALPLAFTVLSFKAMLSHPAEDAAWISWPLVASGLALAASWLSGSTLALMGWSVLLVASLAAALLKCDFSTRSSWGRVIRHRLWNVAIALVNLLVVTAIAVAVVIGWESAFSGRIGLPTLSTVTGWLQRVWPVESHAGDATQALIRMAGAWLGFAVMGAAQVVRGRALQRNSLGSAFAPFLVVWTAVAWLSWWVTWSTHQGNGTDSVVWPCFLLLPLLFFAACGLDSVLRREFSLGTVLTATSVTLCVVSAPTWIARLPRPTTGALWFWIALAGAALVGVGWRITRTGVKSDSYSRFVLLTCVALLILTDVTQGFLSRPRWADDERELQAFRRQLLNEPAPSECWLLSEETIPRRLRFFVRSLWPGVALRTASDWESILAEINRAPVAPKNKRDAGVVADARKSDKLVVTWGSSKRPAEDLRRRGHTFTQTTVPHYFQGRLLKSYRWQERAEFSAVR